jgi:tRNA A-37 threonylcarbamoyl transferase component Bud32
VPNFLGVMRKFHPALCSPPHHLEKFIDDEYLPSAIFLEYIPNLEMIIPENFTEKRMDGFIEGIHQIHKAFVLHNDPKPRNMMVVRGDPAERVVLLDFDRAETYDEDAITDEQVQWISEEEETIVVFKELLVSAFMFRIRGLLVWC